MHSGSRWKTNQPVSRSKSLKKSLYPFCLHSRKIDRPEKSGGQQLTPLEIFCLCHVYSIFNEVAFSNTFGGFCEIIPILCVNLVLWSTYVMPVIILLTFLPGELFSCCILTTQKTWKFEKPAIRIEFKV